MSEPSDAPVKVGETYHLRIEDMGRGGDGIGYIQGFVVFVPGTKPDEWVTVEIESVHETFATATIAEYE